MREINSRTSPSFSVSVKLNSADFQRGGFDSDDALRVVKMLESEHVSLVELSGGSYETPAMQGITSDGRTLEREAFFLQFAKEIAVNTSIPLMTIGGIRRLPIAERVVASGVPLVGIATGLAMEPNLVNIWHQDDQFVAPYPNITFKNKTLRSFTVMAAVRRNLSRIGQGKKVKTNLSSWFTLMTDQIRTAKLTKRYVNKSN